MSGEQVQQLTLRNAKLTDLGPLVTLEAAVFASDRLSPRSFRRCIGGRAAALRVAEQAGIIIGYYLLFFRRGSAVARLYSIAVAAEARGKSLATRMIEEAETLAAQRGTRRLRLEVRPDNLAAIRLYERLGYRRVGRTEAYYEDGADALRYEKVIAERDKARQDAAPWLTGSSSSTRLKTFPTQTRRTR